MDLGKIWLEFEQGQFLIRIRIIFLRSEDSKVLEVPQEIA